MRSEGPHGYMHTHTDQIECIYTWKTRKAPSTRRLSWLFLFFPVFPSFFLFLTEGCGEDRRRRGSCTDRLKGQTLDRSEAGAVFVVNEREEKKKTRQCRRSTSYTDNTVLTVSGRVPSQRRRSPQAICHCPVHRVNISIYTSIYTDVQTQTCLYIHTGVSVCRKQKKRWIVHIKTGIYISLYMYTYIYVCMYVTVAGRR